MIHTATADPIHDRPPKATADELLYDLQSLHGDLLRLEHTATNVQATGAFHAASALVAGLLWPAA